MIAIEIEASIVDHRVNVRSALLPANANRAKIIVMYESSDVSADQPDTLMLARAARSSFPTRDTEVLSQDLARLRGEWNRLL